MSLFGFHFFFVVFFFFLVWDTTFIVLVFGFYLIFLFLVLVSSLGYSSYLEFVEWGFYSAFFVFCCFVVVFLFTIILLGMIF